MLAVCSCRMWQVDVKNKNKETESEEALLNHSASFFAC